VRFLVYRAGYLHWPVPCLQRAIRHSYWVEAAKILRRRRLNRWKPFLLTVYVFWTSTENLQTYKST
jgi:hypothetical protein